MVRGVVLTRGVASSEIDHALVLSPLPPISFLISVGTHFPVGIEDKRKVSWKKLRITIISILLFGSKLDPLI